ncbi:MAG: hypothetical protein AB8I69_02895 [Anaerolineae bacterium]|jgi:hypothetical protein
MNALSWVIGTAVLWVLKSIGTIPLAKLLFNSFGNPEPAPPPPVESQMPPSEDVAISQAASRRVQIPTIYYIMADVAVMGIGGFLLGLISNSFFIGISLRARDWPGMLVFIAASLIGSLF